MRTIKFRGIAVSSGKWVYGNYIHSKRFEGCSNEFRIHEQETGVESDVIPETVGQFTGLQDKNGVEIYEGDLVKFRHLPRRYEINYHQGCFKLFHFEGDTKDMLWGTIERTFDLYLTIEIIGNIHENTQP